MKFPLFRALSSGAEWLILSLETYVLDLSIFMTKMSVSKYVTNVTRVCKEAWGTWWEVWELWVKFLPPVTYTHFNVQNCGFSKLRHTHFLNKKTIRKE